MDSKDAMIGLEVNCPKCRGTEYCRYRVEAGYAYPEAYYYHCEGCGFMSEPE